MYIYCKKKSTNRRTTPDRGWIGLDRGLPYNGGLGDGNLKKTSLRPDNETSTQDDHDVTTSQARDEEAAGKGGRGEIEYYFLTVPWDNTPLYYT